jgi:hypothetical protein
MKRRQFIRSSLSVSFLGLFSLSTLQYYEQKKRHYTDHTKYHFLNKNDIILLDVFIPLFFWGTHTTINENSLLRIKENLDQSILRFSRSNQDALRKLLNMLNASFGRLILAGIWHNWQLANTDNIHRSILSWKTSSINFLVLIYNSLHDLIMASTYAEKEQWEKIGYPGPPL